MQPDSGLDPFDGGVEQIDEFAGRIGMDRVRRLVELDEPDTGGHQCAKLGVDDPGKGVGNVEAVAVNRARIDSSSQRKRARAGKLDRSRRSSAKVVELGDETKATGRLNLVNRFEPLALIVAGWTKMAQSRQRAKAAEPTIEIRGKESEPAHLSIRDDVDAGVFLVAHGN